MMRKFLIVLLAGCCGWTFAGQAARAATTTASAAKPAAKPAISDAETVRYLNPAELAQWNAAAKKIADGQSEITDGQFMVNSTAADANEAQKLDIAGTHAKGAAKIKEGNAMIKDGTTAQDKLRKTAIDRRDAAHQQAAATAAASFSASIAQWPEAIPAMSANILGQLADGKYSQVYFGGVYAFEDSKYTAKPELSAQVLDQLHQLDKDKHTLVDTTAGTIRLAEDNGKLVIDYPSRTSDQEAGVKAALIVGEVLYETNNGYAAFSLRAVDLSNMHIVASQLMMLSVEPAMAKMLGVPAFRVMARRIAPPPAPVAADASTTDDSSASTTPATPPPAPVPAIVVKLQDPNDTLSSFRKPAYVFRMATSGHADTLENRFAALMVKSYFHDQQPGVTITDQDFLSMALPVESGVDPTVNPAGVNTAWVLPNVPDLDVPTIELDALSARDLSNNATVRIGKITIDRILPSQNLPSAAELRAGGYSG